MKHRSLRKKLTNLLGRLAVAGAVRLARRLDPEKIEVWGRRLGNLMFLTLPRYRRVAIRNLSSSFPQWDRREVVQVARETFRHFACSALEFFYMHHLSAEELDESIAIEGTEHLDAALSRGRGVIVVTAHFGNWEAFARKLVRLGYALNVIARDTDDPTMTGIVNLVREKAGYKVLPRDSSVPPALRCLRRNELLGILPDQNSHTGIFVDFFGRRAATATGAAVFALRSGASVVCGFARREGGCRFKAVAYPPLEAETTGDPKADIERLMAAITRAIEDEIRKDPAQWLWIHDRWRWQKELS